MEDGRILEKLLKGIVENKIKISNEELIKAKKECQMRKLSY